MSRNFVSCGGCGPSGHSNTFHHVSKVVLCDRCKTLASFSEDDFHFSWHAQHFGHVHLDFTCFDKLDNWDCWNLFCSVAKSHPGRIVRQSLVRFHIWK